MKIIPEYICIFVPSLSVSCFVSVSIETLLVIVLMVFLFCRRKRSQILMMLQLLSLHRVPTPSAARTSLNWVQSISEAFMLLFVGLTYAFNLEYPKKLTHILIQNIFMCLDDNKPLKTSLLTLKNDLLKYTICRSEE